MWDKFLYALMVAVSGLLIVFLSMTILILAMYAFSFILRKLEKKAPEKKKEIPLVAVKPLEQPVAEEDDPEIIAVITAAIAASLSAENPQANPSLGFKVKSIVKIK